MHHQGERYFSFTPSTNSLMRRCLLRWQDERLFPPFRPCERSLTRFSSNLHFLRAITNAYSIRAEFSGAGNFSKSPKKPMLKAWHTHGNTLPGGGIFTHFYAKSVTST